MPRRVIAAVALIALVAPGALFAQTTGLCSIGRTLMRGTSGTDVTALQAFLNTEGLLTVSPTGYFGSLTEAALANWQLKVGIIASIVDGGVYGPKTRQYVAVTYCGGTATQQQTTTVNQCAPAPAQPLLSCTGTWQKTYGANSCHVGWTCVPAMQTQITNKAPTVTGITGPSKLKPNESGTWAIVASDPENEKLSYSIIWGDEGGTTAQLLELAGLGTAVSSNSSFAHSYASGGYYTIIALAKDSAGNTAKATFAVTIEAPPSTTVPTTNTQTQNASPNTNTNTVKTGASCVDQDTGNVYQHGEQALTWVSKRCCNGSWVGTGNIVKPPQCPAL